VVRHPKAFFLARLKPRPDERRRHGIVVRVGLAITTDSLRKAIEADPSLRFGMTGCFVSLCKSVKAAP